MLEQPESRLQNVASFFLSLTVGDSLDASSARLDYDRGSLPEALSPVLEMSLAPGSSEGPGEEQPSE